MTETVLEQCQRHVAEGAERIARQESLIAEIERLGHTRLLSHALGFLDVMRRTQQLSEEHLARETEPCLRNV
jgi:hypothetical protein